MQFLEFMPWRRFAAWTAILFILLGFLAYGAGLQNEFVLWDDPYLIEGNPILREISPWSFRKAFTTYDPELFIPLTLISYQMDFLIGGSSPVIYHATSLALHIANALLATIFVMLFFKNRFAALCTGMLFLLHPIQSEAVLWASARKDVLSGLFFLISLCAYVRSQRAEDRGQKSEDRNQKTEVRNQKWYWASVTAFLFGLLAKVSIAPLPIVLFVLDRVRGERGRAAILRLLPFFLLSAIFIVIALFGKRDASDSLTAAPFVLLAIRAMALQLQHLLIPLNLSVLYPYEHAINFYNTDIMLAGAVLVLAIILCSFLAMRRPHLRQIIGIAAAFFFVMLAPSFLTVAKGQDFYITSDRYVYLAAIGPFLIAGVLLQRIAHRWQIMLCIVIVLGSLTIKQTFVWRNTDALFTQALRAAPNFPPALMNLGASARLHGDFQTALERYKAAASARPSPAITANIAETFMAMGKFTEARAEYEQGLRAAPSDAGLLFGRGTLAALENDRNGARAFFTRAVASDPSHAQALHKLGVLKGEAGDHDGAISAYRSALESDPFLTETAYNLGVELAAAGDKTGAKAAYERVLDSDPKHLRSLVNIGLLLLSEGDRVGAKKHLERALAVDPGNEIALEGMRRL